MSDEKYRVFLSYRGNSDGLEFEERLYDHLLADPFSKERYGNIFFSPRTAGLGDNFKLGIPDYTNDVPFFVLPLTPGFFDDFYVKGRNTVDENSITYKEITEALKAGCRFIKIVFDGYDEGKEKDLLIKLFGSVSERITCSIKKAYSKKKEEELFEEIEKVLTRDDFKATGVKDLLCNLVPNVQLSFKKDTENKTEFPFYQKLYDVKRITFLNLASTSIISGIDIASIYDDSDKLKRWFELNVVRGRIEANIVITDPHSTAAQDAALYKMNPAGLNKNKDDIILHNMNKLYQFMQKYPSAKLNVYLTKIALPYSIMMTEHQNPENNHIKVDLYSAALDDDAIRPSFYLLQSNKETHCLYSFFENNTKRIMNEYSKKIGKHCEISWLLEKSIIHRGVINSEVLPHTSKAYHECIKAKSPMEVDLLQLNDERIIVGRSDQILPFEHSAKLSDLKYSELKDINNKLKENAILTLREFLDLVDGKVPLLLEIKSNEKSKTKELYKYVNNVLSELRNYADRRTPFSGKKDEKEYLFAIHSANPYALQIVKEVDCTIPCGIISTDFVRYEKEIGKKICRMHEKLNYKDIIDPDFICCDINYLEKGIAKNKCEELGIPLIAWTIHNKKENDIADDYGVDNVIIEGAKEYI